MGKGSGGSRTLLERVLQTRAWPFGIGAGVWCRLLISMQTMGDESITFDPSSGRKARGRRRTGDLLVTNQALLPSELREQVWRTRQDSNLRPLGSKPSALEHLSYGSVRMSASRSQTG